MSSTDINKLYSATILPSTYFDVRQLRLSYTFRARLQVSRVQAM